MKFRIITLLLITLGGCATHSPNQSLYKNLDEMDGITLIVDNFLYEVSENDKIIHHFEMTDNDRFREKLIE